MRPEDVFENIADLMRFGSTMTTSEAGGVTTCTTDNAYTLQDGMLVEIGSKVYPVDNVTQTGASEYTFEITATGVTELNWQLALYYEYGRALEVGATKKEEKDDPVNKNKRFPLMWLLTDIEKNEDVGRGIDYQASIIIGFIYLSEANIKAEKRIDTNFEPISDPLVTLFKNTIKTSPGSRYFVLPYGERYDISLTDKFKYGSVNGNKHVFDDITDAIEVSLTLNFSKTGNCNN
jgi:hypothetical protein